MIRLLLLIAVVAIGADAILNNGAYTQRAWHELSSRVVKIEGAGADARVDVVKRDRE
jgi:hypothetical protein